MPQVLLVNANSSAPVTAHMTEIARASSPHIDFVPITPTFGPQYVLNRADVAIASYAVVDAVVRHVEQAAGEPDACLVACFGEVGMFALRHRFSFPVLNMAEAGILTALQLGTRYGIIAIGDQWPAMLHETVHLYGLAERYVGAFQIDIKPMDLLRDPDAAADVIVERLLAAPRDSIDVAIFGGAALTGLRRLVQPRVPFPLVDCLHASLAQLDAALLYSRLAALPPAAAQRPVPRLARQ